MSRIASSRRFSSKTASPGDWPGRSSRPYLTRPVELAEGATVLLPHEVARPIAGPSRRSTPNWRPRAGSPSRCRTTRLRSRPRSRCDRRRRRMTRALRRAFHDRPEEPSLDAPLQLRARSRGSEGRRPGRPQPRTAAYVRARSVRPMWARHEAAGRRHFRAQPCDVEPRTTGAAGGGGRRTWTRPSRMPHTGRRGAPRRTGDRRSSASRRPAIVAATTSACLAAGSMGRGAGR